MTLILLLHFVFANFQSDKLVKAEITDNITMLVPEDFRPMTDDELASNYFTTRKPLVMYTNRDLNINLGVNTSATQWAEEDFEIMMSFQKANIFSLYDKVTLLSEGTKEINGRKHVYFEFESVIEEDPESFIKEGSIRKYTYIQYALLGKQSLVFNFTCPTRVKDQWATKAQEIMDSIDIKGKKLK